MNEELKRRAERTRLILSNICNGIRPEKVKEAFQLSDLELKQAVDLGMRKVNEWLWRHMTFGQEGRGVRRPVAYDGYRDIHNQGREILDVLDQLEDGLLASPVDMPPIGIQNADAHVIAEVSEKMRHAHAAVRA